MTFVKAIKENTERRGKKVKKAALQGGLSNIKLRGISRTRKLKRRHLTNACNA